MKNARFYYMRDYYQHNLKSRNLCTTTIITQLYANLDSRCLPLEFKEGDVHPNILKEVSTIQFPILKNIWINTQT